ncbi:TonB-dependent receptor [Dyadobacter sp. CY323]|uniref:SusC/RagA family TonB-linked outer membrane protein n=1 Tax=Dyadobacter sp. CY323 TaxID=2907302 RepID=UPI001F39A23C|nr:TonB-dependent receptor [Dyadobacter sp. CY323]MCE6991179.1 TonB-dependent receptor [Dyadobacter sp. CY323]
MCLHFRSKLFTLKRQAASLLLGAALTFAFVLATGVAYARQTVSGKIIDEKGEGIPGVSILLKGTGQGTSSNGDGTFTLDGLDASSTLIFSFVGYVTQEIVVGNRSNLDVTLVSDQRLLKELVVVGYGEQKKVNVIGSVSQIGSDAIENRPVTQVAHAITGQMPGVTVTVGSGRPGANQGTIRVRGVGSFGATPDALVLVDGIPGTLNDISPDDIQSISVLKDASSAAIYGARSANGVILVTTKNGGPGKAKISYNGYVGFNKATKLPDFLNSWEYAEMFNIASGTKTYSAEDIEKYRSQSDPDNFPNTKFLDKLFSENGIQTGHTISINGGNERAKYFLSGGYINQKGIIPKNDFSRYNVRLNLENELGKNFRLTTRIGASSQQRNEPQATGNKGGELTDQLIQNAVRYPAVYLGQASNGDFGVGPESGGTPVSWIASSSYFKNPQNRLSTNMKLNWQPLEGLNFSAIGGYNFALLERVSYNASQRLNANFNLAQSTLNQDRNKEIYKTLQFIGEYSKTFRRNTVDFLLGYSFENEQSDYMSGFRQSFPSNDYTAIDMGGADNQQVNGYAEQWAIQSYFGRLKFNRDDKYLFEATLRYDGSSRFPDNNKYAVFPSLAAGWRLSEEQFLKSATWLSNLKLKASWGILGNQNIGNYPYQTVLNSGRNYPFGNAITTGAAYSTYKDANIKWESTETTDVGIETEFFNRKLGFNVTYFNRNTTDILFKPSASVSTVLGVAISETNTGEAQNKGWEFDGYYRNHIGKLNYSISSNLSIIQNKVVSLGLGNVQQPNGLVGNGSTLFNGYPMEMYYGYLSDGVFQDKQDVDQWPNQTSITPGAQAGDIRYRDISGPNGVPDGKVDATYDRTYLGSRIPKYTYSFNLDLKYKAFDFSVFLQGTGGVQGQLNNYAGVAFFNQGNIQRWQMEERFDPANPQRYPAYPRLEVVTNSGTPNTLQSDFWVLNASYLRVKNVQLGYTMPAAILSKVKIDRVRWYVSIENPITWSKYRQGWDPEVNTTGAYYPILSTYTFGCNIKF